MRFLIKVAFWLTIVVLLLPADPSARDKGRAQVGPVEAFGVAQAAVEDATAFCQRRPNACEVGSEAFQTFGQKAQYGAKLLYEFLSSRFTAEVKETTVPLTTGTAPRSTDPGRHTLTPSDLAAPWSGPQRAVPLPPRRPA